MALRTQSSRRRARHARRAFTLVELMVGMTMLSLVLGGVTSLFLLAMRLCASVTGTTNAGLDGANAAQHVIEDLRESEDFQILDQNSQPASGGQTGVGLKLILPYSSGASLRVNTDGGVKSLPNGTSVAAPYDDTRAVGTGSPYLQIYRSDSAGNASPTGTCLWIAGTGQENGAAVTPHALVKTLDPNRADAVQFSQPTDQNGNPIKGEVQIKIVSSAYDSLHANSTTTSDSANGTTTQLTGQCVYLRNQKQ